VFHTRERLAALTTTLRSSSVDSVRTAVLVVADSGDRGSVSGIRDALARQEHGPDHVWEVAHDPKGARLFDGQDVSRPDRTALVRTAAAVAASAASVTAPFATRAGRCGMSDPLNQHDLVRRLRTSVAERLAEQRRRDSIGSVAAMSVEDEREYARSLIVQVLEATPARRSPTA
jgi:hypothetical protein